jgi:hypothetical protein
LILPSDARYHEQKIGTFSTFVSKIPGPEKWERVETGALQKRRPRNTCLKCNTGWMSQIESAALPVVRPLILGEPSVIQSRSIQHLASVFALISMRIELTARVMKTVPSIEKDMLRQTLIPSENWRIWIARHAGKDLRDYLYRYAAMQISVEPTAAYGPEHCNTHVTTLIVGQLYVHALFSTVWPDFPGYHGAALAQVWPATGWDINTQHLPPMSDDDGVVLHEAISRQGKTVGL